MERSQKEAQVSELRSIFKNMSAAVLVDYRGIEANQVVELRKKLNDASSTMKVIKNSLARIASEDTPFAELADAASLLQRAGFSLPVADSDLIKVSYSDAFKLMRDLRGMVGHRRLSCLREAL